MHFKSFPLVILTVSVALLISSCVRGDYVKQTDPLPVAYKKSMELFQQGNYEDAIKGFQIVFNLGRGTQYATDAQYYLAESHFKSKEYLMAASEYERFISLFPRSDRREDAAFKDAYSYYKLSPRFKIDQKYTNQAIEKFDLFESRYPDSDHTQEIAKYENELREKLAHKIYNAADLYMRTDEYKAAAIYYGLTIDQYPETAWAELALVKQINAYNVYADNSVQSKKQERYQKAIDSYEKYLQLFPQGEHRAQAEEYVDQARGALADLSSTGGSQDSTASSNTPLTVGNNSSSQPLD